MTTSSRLLVTCTDGPGIVAACSNFLCQNNANIIDLEQHSTDPSGGQFFMRLEFQCDDWLHNTQQLNQRFQSEVADKFKMTWDIRHTAQRKKTAILVSKLDHALLELLWLWQRGELATDITMVISNHDDLGNLVNQFGLPFHHIPMNSTNKQAAEQEMLQYLDKQADMLILARYMQILSADFVSHYQQRMINIHHSFLPAFVGADPYRQAYEYGVKVIGATAHYITAELDAGPIIAQDVVHVSHRDGIAELKTLGRNLERQVLAQAVQWHVNDQIIVDGNKTVVFR